MRRAQARPEPSSPAQAPTPAARLAAPAILRAGETCGRETHSLQPLRRKEKRYARERAKPKPDRGRAKGDEPRHRLRLEPPARVKAVTQGAAGERGEADVVAKRERDERRARGLAPGQRMARIARAEPVEHSEAEVARAREGEGGEDPHRRGFSDGCAHVRKRGLPQRAGEENGGEAHAERSESDARDAAPVHCARRVRAGLGFACHERLTRKRVGRSLARSPVGGGRAGVRRMAQRGWAQGEIHHQRQMI